MSTTKQSGEEGFWWFLGKVENRNDPQMLGRCQVRCYRWHTPDQTILPTSALLWAWPTQPVHEGTLYPVMQQGVNINGGIGVSPTGILEGTTVFGFFADGRECQIPVLLTSVPATTDGNNDTSSLATGQNTIVDDLVGPEPASSYKAKYPYNKVRTTEQGHVIEVDDTPGHERIRIYHTKGTYVEVNQDGRRVDKVVDDQFEIIVKDKTVYIGGNLNVVIKGDASVTIEGNADVEVKKNFNLDVGGDWNVSVGGQMNLTAQGPANIDSSIQLNLFAPITTENTIPDIDVTVTE
jgi:hypothetical protein